MRSSSRLAFSFVERKPPQQMLSNMVSTPFNRQYRWVHALGKKQLVVRAQCQSVRVEHILTLASGAMRAHC